MLLQYIWYQTQHDMCKLSIPAAHSADGCRWKHVEALRLEPHCVCFGGGISWWGVYSSNRRTKINREHFSTIYEKRTTRCQYQAHRVCVCVSLFPLKHTKVHWFCLLTDIYPVMKLCHWWDYGYVCVCFSFLLSFHLSVLLIWHFLSDHSISSLFPVLFSTFWTHVG